MGAAKQEITFTDVDGNVVTEEWYFQLDETDAIEMDIIHDILQKDNPDQYLREIVENKDSRKLLTLWKELLFASVCKREGKNLVKGDDILHEFKFGGAYREFFSNLITSDDAGAAFFLQIMPDRVQQQATKESSRTYTNEELLVMSDEDFFKAAGTRDISEMDKRFLTLAMQRRNQKDAAADAA